MTYAPQSSVFSDYISKCIDELFSVKEISLCQNSVDQFLSVAAQLVLIKILIPQKQVFNIRLEASRSFQCKTLCQKPPYIIIFLEIPARTVLHDHGIVVMKMSGMHSKRFEYVCFRKITQ